MTTPCKVVIAMSGGVDSSVAAALLCQQGFEVIGMMLRLWSEESCEEKNACCTPESVYQAKRVAAKLDIPFYVVDAKKIFREAVVQYFIDGYRNGLTPNPCAHCNKVMRWGYLLEYSQRIGADYLATGHYARVYRNPLGKVSLMQGLDKSKDQSYVLSRLNQHQLSRTLFPLGDLEKRKVRQIAEELNLEVAGRPDSQDLCFISGGDYREFLRRQAPDLVKPGEIVNLQGKVIGMHQGLAFFTVGQRQSLGISSPVALYVIRKELDTNRLVVGIKNEVGRAEFEVSGTNWIEDFSFGKPISADVKVRYKAQPVRASVTRLDETCAQVNLERELFDITSGQLAVFYDQACVIGSGIIV